MELINLGFDLHTHFEGCRRRARCCLCSDNGTGPHQLITYSGNLHFLFKPSELLFNCLIRIEVLDLLSSSAV